MSTPKGTQVTPVRTFPYDTLVIAVGSESNNFGTPGVREHAISLDTPLEAKRFHAPPGQCLYPRPCAV